MASTLAVIAADVFFFNVGMLDYASDLYTATS